MKSFLAILCVLAATVSTEAFWVMKMSEFSPRDPAVRPYEQAGICLCPISQLTTLLENVLITERVDPVRSPGAIAPHVHTG